MNNTVHQLAELIYRGSVATVTINNLKPHERQEVDEITTKLINGNILAPVYERVHRQLSTTVAGDYLDRNAVNQDCYIAIWRAVVELLYHRRYQFKCTACKSTTYSTKKGKTLIIDRQYETCPNCGAKNRPIEVIPGPYKHDLRHELLNDETQVRKFFGEFIDNYRRQVLAENVRKGTVVDTVVTGRADDMMVIELRSKCNMAGIKHRYCERTQPINGQHHIAISMYAVSPEFIAELALLSVKAKANSVDMKCVDNGIYVTVNHDAPTISIVKTETVFATTATIMTNQDGEEVEATALIADTTSTLYDNGNLDKNDAFNHVRNQLEGQELQVFDILSQIGQTYMTFSADHETVTNSAIAKFLGINIKSVNNIKNRIKVVCLANDLIPA